jgi:ATP/maltotriose-dependent transcriptional regulator MalT
MTERPLLLAVVCGASLALIGCGSNKPPPPPAVAVPLDALRLGIQSYDDQQFVAATQLFGKALANYRSVDDSRGQAIALLNLADVALVLGEHQRASGHLAEAERVIQRDKVPGFEARLPLLQCQALAQAGDAAAARARCEAVLAQEGIGPKVALGARLELAKLALADGGDWAALRPPLAKAVADDDRPNPQARLLRLDAEVARSKGQLDDAYAKLNAALAIYQAGLYRPGIAATHEELAVVARAQERDAVARDHYQRALTIRFWMSDRVHGADALEGLMTLEESVGDVQRADQLREMLDYLRGSGAVEWRLVQQKYEKL